MNTLKKKENSKRVTAEAKELIATVIVDDDFLKRTCNLFQGAKVKILKQRGRFYQVLTSEGKEVTMKATELRGVGIRN